MKRRSVGSDAHLVPVGITNSTDRGKPKTLPADWASLIRHLPFLANYKRAPHDSKSELHALRNLLDGQRRDTPECRHYLEMANEILVDDTPPSACPSWFFNESGLPSFEDVCLVLNQMDLTKHPGFPGILIGATKYDVIESSLYQLYDQILSRLTVLEFAAEHCSTPEEFYEANCADFNCVSVKSEAIKLDKDGRILNANSIVDEAIERLLFSNFTEAFKGHTYEFYSCVGVGFTKRDSESLHACVDKPNFESDVPHMDAGVTEFENLLSIDAIISSYRRVPARIQHLMRQKERAFCRGIYVIRDGRLFAQRMSGTQKSGRLMTAIFNTMARARRSFATTLYINLRDPLQRASYPCRCAGDDCNEKPHAERELAYLDLRLPLRDARVSATLNFCSHEWPLGGIPIGTRLEKSTATLLLNQDPTLEQCYAYVSEYRSHSAFQATLRIILARRPGMKNKMINVLFTQHRLSPSDSELAPSYTACAKKKNTRKKSKRASKGARKSKKNPGMMAMGGSMAQAMAVCSISNPFCPEALGARWPDDSMTKSTPFSFRNVASDILTVSAGEVHSGCKVFLPDLYPILDAANIPTGYPTTANLASAPGPAAALPTGIARWRITSWGIKLSCPYVNDMTNQGLVQIRLFSMLSGGVLNQIDFSTTMADSVLDIPLSHLAKKPLHIIPMPLGSNARLFREMPWNSSGLTSSWRNPGWQVVVVGFSGVNAGVVGSTIPVIHAELFYNYELVYEDGAASTAFAIAPPRSNPVAREAQANVLDSIGNFVEGTADRVDRIFQSKAMKLLSTGLAAYFGGPMAAGGTYGALTNHQRMAIRDVN